MFEIIGTLSQSFTNCLLYSRDHLEIPSGVKLSYYLVIVLSPSGFLCPSPPKMSSLICYIFPSLKFFSAQKLERGDVTQQKARIEALASGSSVRN